MQLTKASVVTFILILAALVAFGMITFQIQQQRQQENSDVALVLGTDQTEEFSTIIGEPASMEDYYGKVRVVNSWASWSPFSKTELPHLDRLASDYKDRDVIVIAINRNEPEGRAKAFLSKAETLNNLVVLLDGDDSFYKRMDGFAMPETLFFDRDGNLTHHARGKLSYEEMVNQVEVALSAN